MKSRLSLFIQSIAIGIIAMSIGSVVIKVITPDQNIKPLLLSLFIVGFLLFWGIELIGGHEKFCKFYNK